MRKKTKIICTIGPASHEISTLVKMMKEGMNVARLNFSHGTYEAHTSLIKNIRAAAKQSGKIITLLQDLQGPRIRIGDVPKEGVNIKAGETVVFSTAKKVSGKDIPVTYDKLHKEVKKGESILVADGLFEFTVLKVVGNRIFTKVINGGTLTSHKGMNFPSTKLSISSLSTKDKADVAFGISQNVDCIALSFVRSAKDVIELRTLIQKEEKKQKKVDVVSPMIIVKIEKKEAVDAFDEILSVADGVMIARGDLGIEMPAEQVPLLQKMMIETCNNAGKPVIVATQMLESMIVNPRPTRAEVSDVANAVIDKTDAVMLSGESAMGKYPVEAVKIMSKTIAQTESSALDNYEYNHQFWNEEQTDEVIAATAAALSANTSVKMMIVLSMKGATARLVSKHRPELPIVVTTPFARVARQLNLSWGVRAIEVGEDATDESMISKALEYGKKHGYYKKGDQIILVKGHPRLKKRFSHRSIELFKVA